MTLVRDSFMYRYMYLYLHCTYVSSKISFLLNSVFHRIRKGFKIYIHKEYEKTVNANLMVKNITKKEIQW
jgi:hypothetical protein